MSAARLAARCGAASSASSRAAEASFEAGSSAAGISRRRLHASASVGSTPRPLLSFNHVEPPSAEALAAIVDARRSVFGIVQGNGKRSGRKVLRKNLYGPAVRAWYPTTLADLQLHKVGVFNPQQEEVYRTEETNKRLGKSRSKDKLRGPMAIFVDRMKLEDLEDSVLEQVDWFAPQDALPSHDDSVTFLAQEVGMTPAEVAFFLPQLNEAVALEAEEGRIAALAAEAETKSADKKSAKARDRQGFRKGRDDKSLKASGGRDAAGDSGNDASDRLTEEEKAALAKQVESLKPLLAAFREKNGAKLEAAYVRSQAWEKEAALAAGADVNAAGGDSDNDLFELDLTSPLPADAGSKGARRR